MKCPFCGHENTRVIDSRPAEENNSIRRRRVCDECDKRFTTYEKVETIPLIIIKKDNNRETYDRSKIEAGVLRACHKRPISASQITQLIDEVETQIFNMEEKEIESRVIGELVMNKLKDLEAVAYVRFASVYREFKDIKKSIVYKWGYSNLSFDLWMILHKQNCNAELNSVDGYLSHINRAFETQFESMKKYKEEANFKYCLGKLSFPEVLTALSRAKAIMQRNERDGYPITQFKGYRYYIHNPSLDLWQPIETIR